MNVGCFKGLWYAPTVKHAQMTDLWVLHTHIIWEMDKRKEEKSQRMVWGDKGGTQK